MLFYQHLRHGWVWDSLLNILEPFLEGPTVSTRLSNMTGFRRCKMIDTYSRLWRDELFENNPLLYHLHIYNIFFVKPFPTIIWNLHSPPPNSCRTSMPLFYYSSLFFFFFLRKMCRMWFCGFRKLVPFWRMRKDPYNFPFLTLRNE